MEQQPQPTERVLNPMLYAALRQRFGRVLVANRGQQPSPAFPSAFATRDGSMRVGTSRGSWGEYYRVCCFAGETLVATPSGDRAIRDLVGMSTLLIPNAKGLGSWREVAVRSFGHQPLMRLTLSRRRTKKVIRVTPDHRWLVSGRNGIYIKRLTAELRPGDRLASCFMRTLASYGQRVPHVAAIGVAQGFVFGDGSREHGSRRPANVRLNTRSKDKSLLPYYKNCRQEWVESNGKRLRQICDLPLSWKVLPDANESLAFLLGWLAGYFAADGHVSRKGHQATLYSHDVAELQFVKGVCYQLGIRVSPILPKQRRNEGCVPGACDKPLFGVSFPVRDVPPEFWIQLHHRRRAAAWLRKAEAAQRLGWIVESVEYTGEIEEVFCAVVPDVEKFTLADNLLTMNCPYCVQGDDKFHLWVNHLYGTTDDKGRDQRHLALCYRGCLGNPANRSEFYESILGLVNRNARGQVLLNPGEETADVLAAVAPPGKIMPITQVSPHNAARMYLTVERGFDVAWLEKNYEVGVVMDVTDGRHNTMLGRVYIPIRMDGELVGWQGRYPDDRELHGRAKYYNLPNMPRRLMLYNWHIAKHWPFICLTEGAISAWRVGEPCSAILGKTISVMQRQLLREALGKPIFLMVEAKEIAEWQEIENALRQDGHQTVLPVVWPEGRDPADYEHGLVVNFIRNTAAQRGLNIIEW